MANILMQYTCCLIVFTMCIDKGDGRWKKKDADTLQHDISVFEMMAEKIEREIKVFYEDNFGEQIKTSDTGKMKEKDSKNIRDPKTDNDRRNHDRITRKQDNVTHVDNVINITDANDRTSVQFVEHHENNNIIEAIDEAKKLNINKVQARESNWPKFQDILLAMGKQYDWKNDRWIKVKRKLRESKSRKSVNSEKDHETHKFSYRTVKLNSSKSTRNVVIAVTAVR